MNREAYDADSLRKMVRLLEYENKNQDMETRLYRLYDEIEGVEKKEFLNSFVEQVDIYEQEQPDGRFLKHIKFRFPVYFGDSETQELCWDNESTVETVCLMSKKDK